jgi:hypothetical protein
MNMSSSRPTLRQARSFLSRRSAPGDVDSKVEVCGRYWLQRYYRAPFGFSLSHIDRLISILGPEAEMPLSADEADKACAAAQKEVSHECPVAPTAPDRRQSGSDSQEAPGACNRGDADEASDSPADGAQQREPEDRESQSGEAVQGSSAPTSGPATGLSGSEADMPLQGAGQSDTTAGDHTQRDAESDPQPDGTSDAGQPDAFGCHGDGIDTRDVIPTAAGPQHDMFTDAAPESGVGAGSDSQSPKKSFGGCYADADRARYQARSLSRDAKDVIRSLRRLVRQTQMNLSGEQSPRINGRSLVTEIAGRSLRLSRCRREECDMGAVAVLADLSGSCSACAPDTLAAAYAVQAEMPEAVHVIQHSNGIGCDAQRMVSVPDSVRCVVAFGDWDAVDLYRPIIDRGVQLIWLDSFGKKAGVRRSSDAKRGAFAGWAGEPTKFDGVGDAASAAIALRLAIHEARQ